MAKNPQGKTPGLVEIAKGMSKALGEKKAKQKRSGHLEINADFEKLFIEAELKEDQNRAAALASAEMSGKRKSLDAYEREIKKELKRISNSFCRVGFYLLTIREKRLFESSEYKNVYEYAEAALRFKKSTTGNHIKVCERFSLPNLDGCPSGVLKDEYEVFSFSQLVEMLSLSDEELLLVTPEMSVREIRRLKTGTELSPSAPIGSVADESFPYADSEDAQAVCVWQREITYENLQVLVDLLSGGIGKMTTIYIEGEMP